MKKTIQIPNPFYWIHWLFKEKHECRFSKLVNDTPMSNNTNYLVFQCKCGNVDVVHCHRESETYLNRHKR